MIILQVIQQLCFFSIGNNYISRETEEGSKLRIHVKVCYMFRDYNGMCIKRKIKGERRKEEQ